jgi:hypothetical protein
MAITITEILGTDSISGSRLTINANFLLLENAYNDLENTFNINVLTGSLDVSSATSGQIKAKSLLANSLVMPSSGAPTIQIYGTGASGGFIVASSTVAGATGIFSNVLQANTLSASGTATFGATATFNSVLNVEGRMNIGASGNFVNTNRKATVGSSTAFPNAPGAGVTGTYSTPYQLTLTENVIYIQSNYVSSASADAGFTTGFFFYATTGAGATASDIPAGYTVTLVDTATSAGKIATGVTGGTSPYYTGFSTGGSEGDYTDPFIQTSGNPYKTSLTIMWEPRIGQSGASQKGSWVVVNSTSGFTF